MKFYTTYISPIGPLTIFSNGSAITCITFSDKELHSKESCKILNDAITQIHQYFKGTLTSFNLPTHPDGTNFQQHVWNELQNIKYGYTDSYLSIAIKLGDSKKVRAVGMANGKNKIPIIIPCHRIIGSNGKLTGFAGGLWRKKWLLNHERNNMPLKNSLF